MNTSFFLSNAILNSEVCCNYGLLLSAVTMFSNVSPCLTAFVVSSCFRNGCLSAPDSSCPYHSTHAVDVILVTGSSSFWTSLLRSITYSSVCLHVSLSFITR
jgi:hypothetical protein